MAILEARVGEQREEKTIALNLSDFTDDLLQAIDRFKQQLSNEPKEAERFFEYTTKRQQYNLEMLSRFTNQEERVRQEKGDQKDLSVEDQNNQLYEATGFIAAQHQRLSPADVMLRQTSKTPRKTTAHQGERPLSFDLLVSMLGHRLKRTPTHTPNNGIATYSLGSYAFGIYNDNNHFDIVRKQVVAQNVLFQLIEGDTFRGRALLPLKRSLQ